MWGAWVRMRKCSSASFGSGTARNRFSSATSSAELRNPKGGAADTSFAGEAACEVPLRSARKRRKRKTDGRITAEINFIGLLKPKTVALTTLSSCQFTQGLKRFLKI